MAAPTWPDRAAKRMSRVLVVEDSADLAAGIAYNLELEGHDVRVAEDGVVGAQAVEEWRPDVIILDLMLPRMDGYQVLQRIRSRGDRTPVLILTARGEEADRIRGFRLDADQYLVKPFGVLELIERVGALARRHASPSADVSEQSTIRFGDVVLDPTSRTITKSGAACTLTPKAFDLLLALIRRDGAVATRGELLREVWGYGALVISRTVDSHIAELRRKLETDPAQPRHVLTVWKVGYRFVA